MKHATEVHILVDPVQGYEESLTVLGVYGSLAAAKAALPRIRRKPYPAGEYTHAPWRESEVQLWRGDRLVRTWTYNPEHGWGPQIDIETEAPL